ncbi:MAG TPA: bifunctional YncE family protein/alkaline phosphatase family protein [Cyclobacteriaceae bacterium]|nr:bifunctional YncE family protein/alkaline phosphatase family protein [Cyclobacteriaceae bacterium]
MKQLVTVLTIALGCSLLSCSNPRNSQAHLDSLQLVLSSHKVMLPNGWSLTVPGTSTPLGNFPMNLVVSPRGKYMAITHNGEGKQTIVLLNGADGRISDEIEIGKSWFGLVFNDKEDRLYASGGNDNRILIYSIADGKLSKSDSIELGKPWPVKISPTGLAIDDQAGKLFIATKEDSSLYTADLGTKALTKLKLGSEAYACVLSPDKKKIYVSLWGGNGVAVIDARQNTLIARIAVGSHPNDMVLSRDGRTLYVATANDNGVSVIDTDKQEVREVFVSSMYPDSPAGSTPNALALSADEDRLYIANADNNCLAVFDVREPGHGKSAGFVPTGWYPTSVKVLHDKLWITNGKGELSLANPTGPNPYKGSKQEGYIGTLFKGSLSVLDEPTEGELTVYTAATLSNSPYTATSTQLADGEEGNPIPRKAGDVSPIKYVFYIIKENRTYDQVLGDMPAGNGDSTLCLFPEKITPNQHALAGGFVLLDNFYVNAEVSADGHNWSTAAYATDFVEKTWPTNYSRRGGEYDFEGGRKSAFPRDGFIWDYASRAGVSYRSYGEFVWNGKSGLESLQGHFDTDYPSYNLSVPDQVRFEHWKQDFDSLLALDAVPQLNTIRLPNDHTAGARAGSPTPRAMVAEHDQSLGRMIEHLSKSKIWKESVVFILEDDAQNGPDHVDAHRSIAYVAGPYVKRKAHINRMYSTASMLRTIELILGLPPMSQYDAGSTPMWECFTATPDFSPYAAIAARYNLNEKNKDKTALARQTATFNLVQIDAAPDREFNEVIWKTVHGEHSAMPSPVRSAFIKPIPETEDGDDD